MLPEARTQRESPQRAHATLGRYAGSTLGGCQDHRAVGAVIRPR